MRTSKTSSLLKKSRLAALGNLPQSPCTPRLATDPVWPLVRHCQCD